jgi:hypothetical protein
VPVNIQEYLPVLPIDPLNGNSVTTATGLPKTMQYFFATNGEIYSVAGYLESTNNAPNLSADGGSSAQLYELGTGVSISLTTP